MIAHVLQYVLISLIASLVYHALREDDLARAARLGLRRFASFLVLAVVAGGAVEALTVWL